MGLIDKAKDLGKKALGSRTVAYAAPWLTASAAALGSKDARENLTRAYGGLAVGAARVYGGEAGAQAANAALVAAGGQDQLAPPVVPTAPAPTPAPSMAYGQPAADTSSPLGWIIGAAVALVTLIGAVFIARRNP